MCLFYLGTVPPIGMLLALPTLTQIEAQVLPQSTQPASQHRHLLPLGEDEGPNSSREAHPKVST
jgi:hypothetical protein